MIRSGRHVVAVAGKVREDPDRYAIAGAFEECRWRESVGFRITSRNWRVRWFAALLLRCPCLDP